jgi:LmbE family N-acetylglucosaminyl deacetylase
MKSALAIAAHPDDIEFFMSGTMMRLKEAGYTLHYLNIANGCYGTTQYDPDTIAEMRLAEAQSAAEYLGATFYEPLVRDLGIFYEQPTLERVASIVRAAAPEILLTHAPQDYMEDHTNACRLAVTAAFARSMPYYPVDPPQPPIASPVTIYHAQPHGNCDPLGNVLRPSIFVDVTDIVARKRDMLALHKSQKQWLDESQGQDSYLDTMVELGRDVGQMSGRFEIAEGWRRHLHYGFCDPSDNPLVDALGENVIATD